MIPRRVYDDDPLPPSDVPRISNNRVYNNTSYNFLSSLNHGSSRSSPKETKLRGRDVGSAADMCGAQGVYFQ